MTRSTIQRLGGGGEGSFDAAAGMPPEETQRTCRHRSTGRTRRSPGSRPAAGRLETSAPGRAVDHLAGIDSALVAATLGRRDQRLDQRPFIVGQVAWIAKLAPVITGAVFQHPYGMAPANRRGRRSIITDPRAQSDGCHVARNALGWAGSARERVTASLNDRLRKSLSRGAPNAQFAGLIAGLASENEILAGEIRCQT